ncbi:phosphotransferase [Herpetosiphon gulosus]|uniref:Aminoglycoside phosphotransferase domain-containing protein n=1 Tax=Herpetosiphon gulosus TaxID=1973496 RepID=A0ABP9X316_9CHLR
MNAETTWMVNYRLILSDPTDKYLFLLPNTNQLRLPSWQMPLSHFWQDVAHINAWVVAHLGLTTRVLRCIQIDDDFTQHQMTLTYTLLAESIQPIATAAWMLIDQAINDQQVDPSLALLLTKWQTQYKTPTLPLQEVPWYQANWGPAAFAWINRVLAQADIQALGEIQQHRTWNRSSIWQLATTQGRIFFKALPAMFAHEIRLIQYLQAHELNHTPSVLALEPQQAWMLLPDFAAPTLNQSTNLEQWQRSLEAYAQLQIRQIPKREQLAACGLAIRPLSWLIDQIEPLLNDHQAMLLDQSWGLTSAELAQLQAAIPQLKAACCSLQAFNLPDTLEHGDLGASNIIIAAQRTIFTDWSDASISQPFFSLGLLLEGIEQRFSSILNVRETLIQSYLNIWVEQFGLEYAQLRQAYQHAAILTPIHQALTYQHWIKPYLYAPWEMEAMIPAYLRQLISLLEC